MGTGNVLFIFRRDLRVKDNRGLNRAISECRKGNGRRLILAFVFSQSQIEESPYYSEKAFRFMLESLSELNDRVDGKVAFFEKDDFYKSLPNVSTIVFNTDYTPYARARDQHIATYCESRDMKCFAVEDYTLHPIDSIKTKQNTAYQVFGYFHKAAKREPKLKSTSRRLDTDRIVGDMGDGDLFARYTNRAREEYNEGREKPSSSPRGGRAVGRRRLKALSESFASRYDKERDFPEKAHTTLLSPYIKFGCISVREVYGAFASLKAYDLIKQLYWREFYANVAYHYPHVLEGMVGKRNLEMYPKFRTMVWKNDKKEFVRWCEGNTGVPIVDAGMRQLNRTGFMHNRVRMITASFLVKNLAIDWRWGERYFATKLVDYDPASNNGGWQWVAGTGTDAAPYFRVFNPFSQAKRFDKQCKYVLEHVPELSNVSCRDILNWNRAHAKPIHKNVAYPAPMVDLKESATAFKNMVRSLS